MQLRGKVVLVDFWTYSCINCIRTVPYLRAWAKYRRDRGLVVVGVHTPEFKFEEDLVNINTAVGRFKMDYPIAVDSRQQIWRAWGNQYWPALYLADANGKLRHHQFGEGGYDKMERAIQSLLAEAGPGPVDTTLVNPTANDEQMQPDLASLESGEAYVGYQKAENYRATPKLREDRAQCTRWATRSESVGLVGPVGGGRRERRDRRCRRGHRLSVQGARPAPGGGTGRRRPKPHQGHARWPRARRRPWRRYRCRRQRRDRRHPPVSAGTPERQRQAAPL
jgi:thiol-disulfide isomerase/thioredoxin